MEVTCPKCRSASVVRRGFSPTQHRGKQQRYLCKMCGKTFIPDVGFWKMKTPADLVTKAIDLYFSNLSSRKVRNQYRRHEPLTRSHVTVLDWCRKYTLKVQKWIDAQAPAIGGACYADETEIPCGGERHRFWACLDWDTRYIAATHYSTTGDVENAIEFLKKAGRHKPQYIQTDAAQFYPRAFRPPIARSAQPEHLLVRVAPVAKARDAMREAEAFGAAECHRHSSCLMHRASLHHAPPGPSSMLQHCSESQTVRPSS